MFKNESPMLTTIDTYLFGKRKRGGQPGNSNALKAGTRSREMKKTLSQSQQFIGQCLDFMEVNHLLGAK